MASEDDLRRAEGKQRKLEEKQRKLEEEQRKLETFTAKLDAALHGGPESSAVLELTTNELSLFWPSGRDDVYIVPAAVPAKDLLLRLIRGEGRVPRCLQKTCSSASFVGRGV